MKDHTLNIYYKIRNGDKKQRQEYRKGASDYVYLHCQKKGANRTKIAERSSSLPHKYEDDDDNYEGVST